MSDVSRETSVQRYLAILRTWNRKIALSRDLDDERRLEEHLVTADAITQHLQNGRIVDLGTGNGLPIIPILLHGGRTGDDVHLIEADGRKAAFLRAARRELRLAYQVHAERAEVVAPLGASTVTAQAFASLDRLIPIAKRHLAEDGEIIALKGPRASAEIDAARREWDFDVEVIVGRLGEGRCVLRLRDVRIR